MRTRTLSTIALSIVIAASGCGDDGTAPPAPLDVSGVWSYQAPDLVWGPVVCQMTGVTATLLQSDNTFSGTTTGGVIACQSGETSGSRDLVDYAVTDGSVTGTSITFTIASLEQGSDVSITHVGTVTDNSMSGTVTAQFELPPPVGAVVPLTGTWSATR